jgi:hypothetical protein
MGLKFGTLRLPFVRIRDGKSGRTLTWHLGAWSYNKRTGKQTVKLSKNIRWESKTTAQRRKRKPGRYSAAEVEAQARAARRKSEAKAAQQKTKTAQKTAERRQWQEKIAAGQVEGLHVPSDVRSASHPRAGAARRARSGGSSGVVVHRESPKGAAAMAARDAKALADARWDAQVADRMRAEGMSEIRIAKLMEAGRSFRRMSEAPTSAREPAAPAGDPAEAGPAGDTPGRAENAGEAGLCGAPTQDGSPCRNPKGCPHHSTRNGARQQPGRARRRRS